jgi:hypothetical protein
MMSSRSNQGWGNPLGVLVRIALACSALQTLRRLWKCLEAVSTDYRKHSRLALSLAEEYFDAKNLIKHLLERALS